MSGEYDAQLNQLHYLDHGLPEPDFHHRHLTHHE